MTTTQPVDTPTVDERVSSNSLLRRAFTRPELGAIVGAIVVFVYFSAQSSVFFSASGAANWLDPSATLGIMAVFVALLMIGGEFDLSAGVLTGTSALTVAIASAEYNLTMWGAVALALALCTAVGAVSGILVVLTKLPSFIITLATFLALQGVNLGMTKIITAGSVQVGGLAQLSGYSSVHAVFASTIGIAGAQFRVTIIWWVVLTALATYVLLRTRFGNWIFAVGGDLAAARNTGVRTARTKILLFMGTGFAAGLVGIMTAIRFTSVQANIGIGDELIYIVAAVIGGTLLTGGFGSAVGAALGALIFGMVEQGIVYLGYNSDWFKFFLGVMLLLAVLANLYVRTFAARTR